VRRAREQLGFEHCDLFWERDGVMLLYASTRLQSAPTGEDRPRYFLKSNRAEEVLSGAMSLDKSQVAHAGVRPPNLEHLSQALRELLQDDHSFERLAIPLHSGSGQDRRVTGLLYLRGPLAAFQSGQTQRRVKKTAWITQEHVWRAGDLAIVVQRIAGMAELVERHGWLIDELQHSLGQQLQVIRMRANESLSTLSQCGAPSDQLTSLSRGLHRAFQFVHEARAHLEVFAKMDHPLDARGFKPTDLARLVDECCQLMSPQALLKGCRIEWNLQKIQPIWAQKALLRAAVLNLLDNAIKYSWNDRAILVNLNELESSIQLKIENYGVGIPSPDLTRIFNPYFRSAVPDAKGARRGCGIGLAVVKHSIERVHSGSVVAESAPPHGVAPGRTPEETATHPHKTTFTVTLSRSTLDGFGERGTRKEEFHDET
jgi:signal transduction histidine kinase